MMALGPYASFIISSYAGVFLVVAILIGWVMFDHRRQRARLRELEQAGVTRRSRQQSAEAS
jgi:heme exporter protein D